ncbi:nucleotide-binding oligomerization domain-containing protein 2 [Phytophthora cinnamomi]|uniref:nucleotide-binding oligomerization domain-containing protein 2 n=1 Tax=Phytophthora cinnamomi TaxID=4785 RepID=UPI00355A63F5|nr:nucleotide-binding oligomerization domain-containing protein 2 [Phytophthora cinnamomi]
MASDSLGRVQSLQKLCLKAVGRQLKHFCNLRLHPAVAQTLSEPEKQLIYAYDLSRLDVFEAQAFLQTIDAWCVKVERNKRRHRCGVWTSKRVDRALKRFLRVVLLPPADNQVDRRLRELSVALGLEPALMKMELRPPTPLVTPRPRWVSEDLVEPEVPVVEGDKPFTNEAPVHEVVCYRLSAASAGCGIIANLLRTSGALVKLRLNNCQVTDAGAILLASGIRVTKTLQLLDLSNEESVYGDEESMENEVGKNGAQAIALVLERNQTVTRIDLSGNPIGVAGAHAFAEMLRKNTSLQSLQLDRTRIQDGAERLIDAFERSKSLKLLSMLWCALRPGVGTKLASIQAVKYSESEN